MDILKHFTSYRSECYGLMATLNLLFLFTPHNVDSSGPSHTDLLDPLIWRNTIIIKMSYPRLFIKSESEIIMQILHDHARNSND